MRREVIEAIVGVIIDAMAAWAPSKDETHAALATAIKDLAPDRTDKLRIWEMVERK